LFYDMYVSTAGADQSLRFCFEIYLYCVCVYFFPFDFLPLFFYD
jgi:hypothetical protein